MTSNFNYAGTGLSLSDLNELPDHERNAVLARALHDLDERIAPLKQARDEAERWLKQYAFNQGAGTTLIDAGDFEVKVQEDVRWEYDVEGLSQLLGFGVTQEQFEDAIQPTYKVNKTKLNALVKRGGRIRDIIDQNCRKHITGVKLFVRRVKEPAGVGPRVYDVRGDGIEDGLDLY